MSNPNPNLRFGVIHMGTSPDFCQFHNIPIETDKAISLLREGYSREIPVLQANGRCFFCSCNLGMGADIATLANRIRPYLGDRLGTFLAVLRNLFRNRKWNLDVNGESLRDCNHFLITRIPHNASTLIYTPLVCWAKQMPPYSADEGCQPSPCASQSHQTRFLRQTPAEGCLMLWKTSAASIRGSFWNWMWMR
ncbi:MAG: hypothetical protein IJJ33_14170 [Victivallales bacterium]|nr:hypothetical protein [Victivallales bacterium]